MERHDKLGDELEAEADALERESSQVEDHIDEARGDWERKRQDDAVPGARPRQEDMARSDPEEREGPPADEAGQ